VPEVAHTVLDLEIDGRAVSHLSLTSQEEADRPNLPRLQRVLGANLAARILSSAVLKSKYHVWFPAPLPLCEGGNHHLPSKSSQSGTTTYRRSTGLGGRKKPPARKRPSHRGSDHGAGRRERPLVSIRLSTQPISLLGVHCANWAP
jgi:hypothetical protein